MRSPELCGFAVLCALSLFSFSAARADDAPPAAPPAPAPDAKPAERGYLGFMAVPAAMIPEESRAQAKVAVDAGVVIVGMAPGGPASKSGMKVGDVLVKVGGVAVPDTKGIDPAKPETYSAFQEAFGKVAQSMKVGVELEVVVQRDGSPVTLKATPITLAAVTALQKAGGDEDGEGKEAPEGAKPAGAEATRGYVGFAAVPAAGLSAKLKEKWKVKADHGVVAVHIMKGSPAEKAGLVSGDVIVKYAGMDVPTDKEIEAAKDKARETVAQAFAKISVAAVKPGGEVAVVVLRDGKPVTLKATAIGRADIEKIAQAAGEDEDDEGDEGDEKGEGPEKGAAMEPEKGAK